MNNSRKAAAKKPSAKAAAGSLDAARKKVNYKTAKYKTYSLQGRPQPDLSWHNISYDEKEQAGIFLIRFQPGGTSIPHEHLGYEEFVMLEGEIEDSDGTVYRSGDCVSLAPGSKHVSVSRSGATAVVFVRGGFRTLKDGEKVDR